MKNLCLVLLAASAATLTACNSGDSSSSSSSSSTNINFLVDGAACSVNTYNESGSSTFGGIPGLYESSIAPTPDPYAMFWNQESDSILLNAYYAGGGNFSFSLNGGTPVTGKAGGFAYVVADVDPLTPSLLHSAAFVVTGVSPFVAESTAPCLQGSYTISTPSRPEEIRYAQVIECTQTAPTTTGGAYTFSGTYQVFEGIGGSNESAGPVIESGPIGFTCPTTVPGSVNININVSK